MPSKTAAESAVLQLYADEHPMCELHGFRCGRSDFACDLHHILGGSRRAHEAWNLLAVCRACHTIIQGNQIWRHVISVQKRMRNQWDGKRAWELTNPGKPYGGEYDRGYPA